MERYIYIEPLKSTSLGDEISMQTSPLYDVFIQGVNKKSMEKSSFKVSLEPNGYAH